MLSIGGDSLQFYPNFALFSTLEGMNLNHNFFQVSKLSEDQKIRSSPKQGKLCSLNCSGDLRSNAYQSQIIGWMQMQTILKIIGGDTVKSLGGYIFPSPPPGFGTPVGEKIKQRQTNVEETDLWETIIRVEAQNKA